MPKPGSWWRRPKRCAGPSEPDCAAYDPLKEHFYSRSTGEIISGLLPNLRITNAARGTARIIYTEPRSAFLLACVRAVHLPEDGHFGDNFYLPEGVYTFTALVGDEVAVFEDVALSDP